MVRDMMENSLLLLRTPFLMGELMRNQRFEPSELRRFQNKRLRAMIEHCYRNVKYYRSLFMKANLSYSDIKTVDDLEKIPITMKEDVIDLPTQSVVAKNVEPDRCVKRRTSGTSSGVPMIIYWQKSAVLRRYLQYYRWQLKCGGKITDRQLVVDVDWVPVHPIQRLGIFKTKRISVFNDTETQIRTATKFNPKTVVCLSSFIDAFAREVRERDEKGIRPRLIFAGGEALTQHVRSLAREVFEAEVFCSYGATEFGFGAGECVERVGFHVESDSTVVEVTRDGEAMSPGEEGELTVTNLTNYAMPFIRYSVGDLGSMLADRCSCGTSFPLIKMTLGRKGDLVRLPGGKTIPALMVWGSLIWIPGIKQLQVVQEKLDRFVIKIVKSNNFTFETCRKGEQMLRQNLGNVKNLGVEAYVVDKIPRERSGKLKHFVTRVSSRDD